MSFCSKFEFFFFGVVNYREGDDQSRDEGHHGDEEDSNATSISDAMIDDEIADQPGLVMLGQVDYCSYSVGFLFLFLLGCFWFDDGHLNVNYSFVLFFFVSSRTQFRRHRCILGDPNCFITTYRPCP